MLSDVHWNAVEAWNAVWNSALRIDIETSLLALGFVGPAYAKMKSVRLGAAFGVSALPLGIFFTVLGRSLDASIWGLIVVPIMAALMFKGLVTNEGFDPQEIQAKRMRMLRSFLRLNKR